jgi:predicted acylesterase/phospholipase RssA
VCATSKDLYHIKRLRSYKLPGKSAEPVTVIQAALATSAATTFFDPVLIGTCKYADGALGANNPVDEVEAEAADLWCPKTANLQSLVKCFLSVGTGNSGEKAVGDRVDQFASTLARITTETEKTAIKFLGRWRRAYELKRYFRFNVQQGLQDVSLEEYKKQPVIQRASEMYLDHYEQVSKVNECVGNLAGKQSVYHEDFS